MVVDDYNFHAGGRVGEKDKGEITPVFGLCVEFIIEIFEVIYPCYCIIRTEHTIPFTAFDRWYDFADRPMPIDSFKPRPMQMATSIPKITNFTKKKFQPKKKK